MTFTRWSDIRDEHMERVGQEEFEAGQEQILLDAGNPVATAVGRQRLI
jgi:hypothetical protein